MTWLRAAWKRVLTPLMVLFCIPINAQQLAWTASPSSTGNTFATQAEALGDLHAFSPAYALVTELVSTTQQDDKIVYKYKVPDADPIIGDWLYYSTYSNHPGFPTEAEAFDELLQTVVDARISSAGGCPPLC